MTYYQDKIDGDLPSLYFNTRLNIWNWYNKYDDIYMINVKMWYDIMYKLEETFLFFICYQVLFGAHE